jgi:peroxiredoxin Q/BCP
MIKEGQKAPDFTLTDTNESDIKLSDFKGKWVILYFYPKDMTPGCTIEAMEFSALKKEFEKLNAVVLGVSKDSCASHQKFTDKKELTINLLSDPDSRIQKLYEVWKPKKFMGREFLGTVRTTFLISPDQTIKKIWNEVKARGHAEAVLRELANL